MAIVDMVKNFLYEGITKEFNRSTVIDTLHPYRHGGFFPDLSNGIYQMVRYDYGRVCRRIEFYDYVITHTEAQNIQRDKFRDAVHAWQALTSEQKIVYDKLASGKYWSGYNLFLKKYLKTH